MMGNAATMHRLQPTDARGVAEALRQADHEGRAVVLRGRGTKARWGAPPSRAGLVLSLTGLRQPIEHCAGDLTVTAPAGATLGEVNAVLAEAGQWLPVDPWGGPESTVGGLLATNDSGPRRHRFGSPRDLVIGVEFALVDGRTARAGGRVVKNVAGYDLGRLLCGSFGALAAITAATFKLSPRPAASRTVVIDLPSREAFLAIHQAISQSPLTPTAVEVSTPPPRFLVRFETTADAADRQAAMLVGVVAAHGASATLLHGAAEAEIWTRHHASMHPSPESTETTALVRVNVVPLQVVDVLERIDALATDTGLAARTTGRAMLGALYVSLNGSASSIASLVSALRTSVSHDRGHVAVLDAPPAVHAAAPAWDDVGPAAAVMRAVKRQFDPRGTLCPGGGPGGVA
ncbi:MAG: FAD-binding oxidoreductase [Vicinamibacterales bacterium]